MAQISSLVVHHKLTKRITTFITQIKKTAYSYLKNQQAIFLVTKTPDFYKYCQTKKGCFLQASLNNMVFVIYITTSYSSNSFSFFFSARFNCIRSFNAPPIQYGISADKNNNSQNPIKAIMTKARKPKY